MNMIVRRHDPKKRVNKISYLTFQNCFNSFSCQKHNLKIKQLNSCRNDRETKNKHSLSISIYGNSEMESDDSVTDSIVACRDGLCLWGSS